MIDEIVEICRIALVQSATENKEFYTCAAVFTFGAIAVQLARYQLQQQYVDETPAARKGPK